MFIFFYSGPWDPTLQFSLYTVVFYFVLKYIYFPSLSFILKTNIFTVQNGNVYISEINHTGILSALLSMKYIL